MTAHPKAPASAITEPARNRGLVGLAEKTIGRGSVAEKIRVSRFFDNATSCSPENAVVVVEAIYDVFIAAMSRAGGPLVDDVTARFWPGGHLIRDVVAQDADRMIEVLGLAGKVRPDTEYIAVATCGIGPAHALSGEKLSPVLAL